MEAYNPIPVVFTVATMDAMERVSLLLMIAAKDTFLMPADHRIFIKTTTAKLLLSISQ